MGRLIGGCMTSRASRWDLELKGCEITRPCKIAPRVVPQKPTQVGWLGRVGS